MPHQVADIQMFLHVDLQLLGHREVAGFTMCVVIGVARFGMAVVCVPMGVVIMSMIVVSMACFAVIVVVVVIIVRVIVSVVVRIFYFLIVVINVQNALPHAESCRLKRQASK